MTPTNGPCMRALYHYVATGKTLPSFCYRNVGEPNSDQKVDDFIAKMLQKETQPSSLNESVMKDDAANLLVENEQASDEDGTEKMMSDGEQELDSDLVAGRFREAMSAYTELIVIHHSRGRLIVSHHSRGRLS